MSALGPMYDIPATIRHGIEILTKWDNKEAKEYGLENIRHNFNESASELTPSQLQEVMDYLTSITEYLNGIINGFSSLGIEIEKEKEKKEQEVVEKEYTGIQKFAIHMFKDYKYILSSHMSIISSALNVVNIAKEEIAKHLPEVCVYNNADGVVLRKITRNISE